VEGHGPGKWRFYGRLKVREVWELSRRYAELQTRVYELRVDETLFGGFFVNPTGHTLSWDTREVQQPCSNRLLCQQG
jgi:hypothetical protein